MKLIYILGLEHSGTTLTDHLLSSHSKVLGLGEIAAFFSTSHMSHYASQWSDFDDAFICSCGDSWRECSFWSGLEQYSGLNSDLPFIDKYRMVLEHAKTTHGADSVIVDSSKSLDTLQNIVANLDSLNLTLDNVLVVFALKDVRSFAASMRKTSTSKSNLWHCFRNFNYWLGANKAILNYLRKSSIRYQLSLYETLCENPQESVNHHLRSVQLTPEAVIIKHSDSHIAMGNKDFITRNRETIEYDNSWFDDGQISLMYSLHVLSRRFNNSMYALAQQQ